MLVDNEALGQTLRPRGADELRVLDFENLRPHQAHQRGHSGQAQHECGQYEMVDTVRDLAPGVEARIIGRKASTNRKPTGPEREVHREKRQKKCRHRHSKERQERKDAIEH